MSTHPFFIIDDNKRALELYDTPAGKWTEFERAACRFMTLGRAIGVAKTMLRNCSVVSRDGNGRLLNHYAHNTKA